MAGVGARSATLMVSSASDRTRRPSDGDGVGMTRRGPKSILAGSATDTRRCLIDLEAAARTVGARGDRKAELAGRCGRDDQGIRGRAFDDAVGRAVLVGGSRGRQTEYGR